MRGTAAMVASAGAAVKVVVGDVPTLTGPCKLLILTCDSGIGPIRAGKGVGEAAFAGALTGAADVAPVAVYAGAGYAGATTLVPGIATGAAIAGFSTPAVAAGE